MDFHTCPDAIIREHYGVGLEDVDVVDQNIQYGPGDYPLALLSMGYVKFDYLGGVVHVAWEEWPDLVVGHVFVHNRQWHSHTYKDGYTPVPNDHRF